MSWFDDVIDYIGIPNAIEKRRCFVLDGCRINFGTLPDPSLVLSVPHLQSPNSPVRKFIEGHERCDLFVVALRDANPIVVFVEAKSGNDRDYRDSEKAVSQLRSSFGIFINVFENAEMSLPFTNLDECDMHATCVMESMRANLGSSITQREFENEFYRETRVPFRYISAEMDIWQEIQRNRR